MKGLHVTKSTILTKSLHIPLRSGQICVHHIRKTLVSSVTRWEWARPYVRTCKQSVFAWSNVHKHFCCVPGWMYTHRMSSSWQHMPTDTLEEWMNLQSCSQRGSQENDEETGWRLPKLLWLAARSQVHMRSCLERRQLVWALGRWFGPLAALWWYYWMLQCCLRVKIQKVEVLKWSKGIFLKLLWQLSQILFDTSDTQSKTCISSWGQDINPRMSYPTDLKICLESFFLSFSLF